MVWKIGQYNYEGLIGITHWNYVSLEFGHVRGGKFYPYP